jgi:hypothetical protein
MERSKQADLNLLEIASARYRARKERAQAIRLEKEAGIVWNSSSSSADDSLLLSPKT